MAKRYLLPGKPPRLKEVFHGLCKNLSQDQLQKVRQEVVSRQQQIGTVESEEFLAPNHPLGLEIAKVCLTLLDDYDQFSDEEKKLIAGATLYFIAERDFNPDDTPITGYDDDARVLNYVLEEIEREDLVVNVD